MDKLKESYLKAPSTAEPSVSGVTTPDLIAEEKEQQTQSSRQSISDEEKATLDDAPVEEYPTGTALIPIIFALVCAIFLVAVDVTILGEYSMYSVLNVRLLIRLFHRHRYPKNHRRIRRPELRILVRLRVLHDLWRSPTRRWEVLQVLPSQDIFPRRYFHLHHWQLGLRRFAKLNDVHCWPCVCWCGCFGCGDGSVYDCGVCCGAEETACADWVDGCNVWVVECTGADSWGGVYG